MKKLGLPILLITFLFVSCQKDKTANIDKKNLPKNARTMMVSDTSGFTTDSLTEAFIVKSTQIK